MPILDNPRHERFAQALAKGLPASRAYVEAGYAENDSNSARLSGNERVRARVLELQQQAAKKTVVTVESITDELNEAMEFARTCMAPAAFVSAIMGKAKLNGLLVDKTEVSGSLDIGTALQAARRRARMRNTSEDMSGDTDGENQS
ncbi:hypothetical protein [Microvirga sp. G4-2]|uniref:hypothetical protein n=1 Tax=Microvirga sp. G4-2 TaxID=3434467 RepID=UPI004043C454